MKTCKMIVMDMDGTLLNDEKIITEKTYHTLIKAQEKGMKVVLASGRSYKSLTAFGELLKMDQYDGWFVGVNGAAITEVKTMTHTVMAQLQVEDIQEIFNTAYPHDVEIMGVLDATIYDYIPESFMEIKKKYKKENNIPEEIWTGGSHKLVTDQRKGYPTIYTIQSANEINCPVNKMTLCHTSEVIDATYNAINPKLEAKYNLTKTSPIWIEIVPKSISKGNAIRLLQEKYGITKEETYIFGDGENDLSMFDCGNAVAMGNAMDTVKAQADEITLDNNSDGIAAVIERFL